MLTEKKSQEFLDADYITSFENLLSNLSTDFPSSWNAITLKKDDKLTIEDVEFNEDGKPSFRFSLAISTDLKFSLFVRDLQISPSRIKHITDKNKIERHTDVQNILAFLNSYAGNAPNILDPVEDCIQKLSRLSSQALKDDEQLSQKIDFIIEQLSLAVMPVYSRKYSTKLLWNCLTWMKIGPATYKQILSDGMMTLPSLSCLRRLSGAYHLETGGLNKDVKNVYLFSTEHYILTKLH